MCNDETAYFRQRANEERERALTASEPSIADIHLALAARYETLIEQEQARSPVSGGMGTMPA